MTKYFTLKKCIGYSELMRLEKPVGIYLLLWPTLWALWIAAQGQPNGIILMVFVAGVFLMRSAGCVINDFADRKVDGHVARTKNRPLASGRVTSTEALVLFGILVTLSFCLVLLLNWQTILLSVVALGLAALYPFMKRFTYLPQFFLGAAFSWAIPMAFMAVTQSLPNIVWLLYVSNLTWTIAYDTLYAMVDKEDDLKIGVKSTAILFGRFDIAMVLFLQLVSVLLWVWVGQLLAFGIYYYLALTAITTLFLYHAWMVRQSEPSACFKAFLQNHYAGLFLFCGLAAEYHF